MVDYATDELDERRWRLERELDEAGLTVIVEDEGDLIRLEGRVDSPEARQAAADVVSSLAPEVEIENNLEIEAVLPQSVADFNDDEVGEGDLPASLAEIEAEGSAYEPDFTDQELATSPTEMADAASTTIDPQPDGATVFFPPTDPVVTTDASGQTEVLGGFAPTAMTDDTTAPVALDGQPGDEAIADAVRRDLRLDALTTDLTIDVVVRQGVVRLRGVVPTLDDAESAEEVAGRAAGVVEVIDDLEVTALDSGE